MFQVPSTAAECADLLYTLRQKRLAMQKDVDEVAEQERQIKDVLIDALPKGEASGVAGKIARVSIVRKDEPQADDWMLIQAYIKRTNSFDLLQRRLNAAAIKERWAERKEIPGVAHFVKVDVSCVKV